MRSIAMITLLCAAACGGGDDDDDDDVVTPDAGAAPDATPISCEPDLDYAGNFPAGAVPCTDAVRWPHLVRSDELPVVVHYSKCDDTAMAVQVLAHVEHAWRVEVDELGFTAPLPDGGACGADDAFDVFLWPDVDEAWVEATAENLATTHDDWFTFMVVDPWGFYGGELLDSTIAHELNHACQAADDWWEHIIAFEMTATFIEEVVYPDDNDWLFVLDDYQANPDWSVDLDDGYETWHMYGAAMLLHFVRERYFAGDASFAAQMWRDSRNPPGDNEPDFEDALDGLLGERAGVSFADAVGEFAAWRWYTGDRSDGDHFADGALYPQPAVAATVTTTTADVSVDPMMYGSVYVDVVGTGSRSVSLSAPDVAGQRWLVQAVPGAAGATADELNPAGDTLDLDGFDGRTVVITALPDVDRDPDEQTETRYPATLVIAP